MQGSQCIMPHSIAIFSDSHVIYSCIVLNKDVESCHHDNMNEEHAEVWLTSSIVTYFVSYILSHDPGVEMIMPYCACIMGGVPTCKTPSYFPWYPKAGILFHDMYIITCGGGRG